MIESEAINLQSLAQKLKRFQDSGNSNHLSPLNKTPIRPNIPLESLILELRPMRHILIIREQQTIIAKYDFIMSEFETIRAVRDKFEERLASFDSGHVIKANDQVR